MQNRPVYIVLILSFTATARAKCFILLDPTGEFDAVENSIMQKESDAKRIVMSVSFSQVIFGVCVFITV